MYICKQNLNTITKHILMSKKLFILTLTAFCLTNLTVKAQENLHIDHLHAEMLRLISTPDKEGFTEVTEQLKEECHKAGNKRMFYVAWGNQSTYKATVYLLIGAIVTILAIVLLQHRLRIKRLEKEKAQLDKERKKAEKAFDMKNEFITQITNELREPLNPIQGFTSILGTKEYELQPDEREQLSKHIHDNSRHLSKIIDEMAELSFYESKKSLPIDYKLSPNHLFRHMVDSMRPRCKEGVRMFFESDLPEDFIIEQNGEALENLLKHLLDNAIQYTEKGVITVACTQYSNMVRTSVTDTGCGITHEHIDHIFDTFIEVGDTTQLNGLGLPICKAIVKLLKGKIWLDTDYKDGARFVFDIPWKKV